MFADEHGHGTTSSPPPDQLRRNAVRTALRIALLSLGLALFGWFLHRAGPKEVLTAFAKLGWLAPVVLLPYGVVYVVDTLGWHFAFGQRLTHGLGFWTLFRIRWAGEAINNVIPSVYVGGEAVKVYLLRKRSVPTLNAAASVVIGRTAQTLSQVMFILSGSIALVCLASEGPSLAIGIVVIILGGCLAVAILFAIQRHGIFSIATKVTQRLNLRIRSLAANREKWQGIDRQIWEFYARETKQFFLSTGTYLSGWLLDTVEIFVVAPLMGVPIHWNQALAVEAFVGVAKVLGLFVPGALGVQESSIVFLCRTVGLPEGFGVAYAILRRGREAVYAFVGWLLVYSDEVRLKDLASGSVLESKN
ncbi:MAG: flippase-like domain-containing protein [Verrucomicrobia bacterium]|nr:flippase-like domain-containing protein [Verrucomicrobiota bacterium]